MLHRSADLNSTRYQVGTLLFQVCDSRFRIFCASLLMGAAASALEFIVHNAVSRSGLTPAIRSFVDATSVGIAIAVCVAALLFAGRARRKRVLEEMGRVAELNHQVRNALQIIAHSHYGRNDEHTTMVLDSVERIERTLKQLFPARRRE